MSFAKQNMGQGGSKKMCLQYNFPICFFCQSDSSWPYISNPQPTHLDMKFLKDKKHTIFLFYLFISVFENISFGIYEQRCKGTKIKILFTDGSSILKSKQGQVWKQNFFYMCFQTNIFLLPICASNMIIHLRGDTIW